LRTPGVAMSDRPFIHQILKTTNYDAYGQPPGYKGHVLRLTRSDERPQNPALPFAYLFPALENMEGKQAVNFYDPFFGYNYYFELATLSDDHANTNSRPNTLPKRPRYFFAAPFSQDSVVDIEGKLIPAFDDNMIEDLRKLGVLFMSGRILKVDIDPQDGVAGPYLLPDDFLSPFMADLDSGTVDPSGFRPFQVFSLLEPEHYIGGDLFLYYESLFLSNTFQIYPETIRIDTDDAQVGYTFFIDVGISEIVVDYARWNRVLAQFNEHVSRYRKVFVYTPGIRMGEPDITYYYTSDGQLIGSNEGFARAAVQAVYDIQMEFRNLFSSQVPDHVEFYVSDYTLDQTAGVLQEMSELIHTFFTQD